MLDQAKMRRDLDKFLKTAGPVSFPQSLCYRVRSPLTEAEKLAVKARAGKNPADPRSQTHKYNVPLINSIVLYIGVQAIQNLGGANPANIDKSNAAHTIPMELLQSFLLGFDGEGRYHVANAIANQLRYPNSHTHYFSCVLLYIFSEARDEVIKEQITRVLLERLIVHRPHPWGLLITFIELIKNGRYQFWQHKFTHCEADIKRLFESVARSCGAGAGPTQQSGAGN